MKQNPLFILEVLIEVLLEVGRIVSVEVGRRYVVSIVPSDVTQASIVCVVLYYVLF